MNLVNPILLEISDEYIFPVLHIPRVLVQWKFLVSVIYCLTLIKSIPFILVFYPFQTVNLMSLGVVVDLRGGEVLSCHICHYIPQLVVESGDKTATF